MYIEPIRLQEGSDRALRSTALPLLSSMPSQDLNGNDDTTLSFNHDAGTSPSQSFSPFPGLYLIQFDEFFPSLGELPNVLDELIWVPDKTPSILPLSGEPLYELSENETASSQSFSLSPPSSPALVSDKFNENLQ